MNRWMYSSESINKMINLLNSLELKGIKNAQAVVQLTALISSGEPVEVIKAETGGKE